MEKQELVAAMIEATTQFQLGQIQYRTEKNQICVWSDNAYKGSFHGTEIIPIFRSFATYMGYDSDNSRVELIIFWS